MDTFKFFNHEFAYIQQNKPATEGGWQHIGERTVEIPICKLWLSKFNPATVKEVGAVMPWFWNAEQFGHHHDPVTVPHMVIDPADAYPLCIKNDGEKESYINFNVLSISTVEHIGLAEYGNQDIDSSKGTRVVEKIMKEASNYLINWPLTHNRFLDNWLRKTYEEKGGFSIFMLKQVTPDNRWELVEGLDWSLVYGPVHPTLTAPYQYANGIVFVTNHLNWI